MIAQNGLILEDGHVIVISPPCPPTHVSSGAPFQFGIGYAPLLDLAAPCAEADERLTSGTTHRPGGGESLRKSASTVMRELSNGLILEDGHVIVLSHPRMPAHSCI